jgi:hypothetical protein
MTSKSLKVRSVLAALALSLAASHIHAVRYDMNADGISYLDLAGAFARGDWANSVNSYWGPAYPILLGLVEKIEATTGLHEFVLAHLVNLLLFAAAVLSFDWFWRCVADAARIPGKTALWLLGYLLLVSLLIPTLNLVTPDLLLAILIFLIAGSLWRWTLWHQTRHLVMAGVLLGVSYYAKSIMIPVALVTLSAAAILCKLSRRSLKPTLIAAVAFVIVVLPLVSLLSARAGRLAWGDAGRLSYAWAVHGNIPANCTSVLFPPGPSLNDHPRVFRIRFQPNVTYAPWFNPSAEGKSIRPIFRLGPQLKVLAAGFRFYRDEFLFQGAVLLTAALILFAVRRPAAISPFLLLLIFAVPPLVTYALVFVEGRYIYGFEIVLWGIVFGAALSGEHAETENNISRSVLRVAVLLFFLQVLPSIFSFAADARATRNEDYINVVQAIQAEGLQVGDKVAVVGSPLMQPWAKLTRTSIVAVIPAEDAAEFCTSGTESQNMALSAIRQTGATWIVSGRNSVCSGERWQRVPGTSYTFRILAQ